MKLNRIDIAALIAVILSAVILPMKAKASPHSFSLSAKQFKSKVARKAQMRYLVYQPPGYGSDRRQLWPLVLFLHGSGERGTNLQDVAIHGPLKLVRQGREFPFLIVAPQCPNGQDWSSDALLKLLEHATRTLAVDTNRIYLTGLSMGGYGTWRLGMAHPEKFAALAPICGGGYLLDVILPGRERAALRRLPVWAFHGARDTAVPPEESERMIHVLEKIGAKDVKLTLYPEAGHDSWTETYNDPEFYEWLLSHRRRP